MQQHESSSRSDTHLVRLGVLEPLDDCLREAGGEDCMCQHAYQLACSASTLRRISGRSHLDPIRRPRLKERTGREPANRKRSDHRGRDRGAEAELRGGPGGERAEHGCKGMPGAERSGACGNVLGAGGAPARHPREQSFSRTEPREAHAKRENIGTALPNLVRGLRDAKVRRKWIVECFAIGCRRFSTSAPS